MKQREEHYPCEAIERKQVKTKNGFRRICKKCGFKFKEVKRVTTTEDVAFYD